MINKVKARELQWKLSFLKSGQEWLSLHQGVSVKQMSFAQVTLFAHASPKGFIP